RVHLASRRPDNVRTDSSDPLTRECARQLLEYFDGKRRHFDIPLELKGTDFEVAVWKRLLRVPFGQTASYKEIAAAIKRPAAFRAVGAANGRNPIAVIVPCHRIIGHDGRLVGYGGGLWRKRWLLEHESRNLQLA
ncbi:MAG: methylated-DNA--[protein]-cysteine S-methyltransferase, partial [Candidatus Aminicenantes bacterium]|nr:methylated-DNA--[protein]-cysteine S-methyltransferase [Candidatus Aminicenantes bacterium]